MTPQPMCDSASDPVVLSDGPNEAVQVGAQPRDLLEWCAWRAGEAHSANPDAVSPLLTAFVHVAYDWLPNEHRQSLVPLIPVMIQTGPRRESDHMVRERDRAVILVDYATRFFVPLALERDGFATYATRLLRAPGLTGIPQIPEAVERVQEVVHALGDNPTTEAMQWTLDGIVMFHAELSRELAYRCFDPVSLSLSSPVEARCIRFVIDCVRALISPRRTPRNTRRGWAAA